MSQAGKLFHIRHFLVVGEYKMVEIRIPAQDRIEEGGQLFLRIISPEKDKQLLQFHFLQVLASDTIFHILVEQVEESLYLALERKCIITVSDVFFVFR